MATHKINPRINFTVIILFSFILLSLQLMSSATQESSALGELYSWLLLINALGSIVLLGLVIANIITLTQQFKKKRSWVKINHKNAVIFYHSCTLANVNCVLFFHAIFTSRH